MTLLSDTVALCNFPPAGTEVDLGVSGGADSVGLTLLALAHELVPTLHHVDHHLRDNSDRDAQLVVDLARATGCPVVVHDVVVAPGGNLESRARAARRSVLPRSCMTGHTMDDLAETVVLNLLRGAGVDGLSPMVGDGTKPLLEVRRRDLRRVVEESGQRFVDDPTNEDQTLLRNRVRRETIPYMCDVAQRDVVPIFARQAHLMRDERAWLDELVSSSLSLSFSDVDCRELVGWPTAHLRRWLRHHLGRHDDDGIHPPSADEIERVLDVVHGRVVATEVSGHRRVTRRGQRLGIETTDPLRSTR